MSVWRRSDAVGVLDDYFETPADRREALLGIVQNIALDVEPEDGADGRATDDMVRVARLPAESVDVSPGDHVTVGIRPERLKLDGGSDGSFDASVAVTEYQGNENFVHVHAGGHDLTAVVSPRVAPDSGDTVSLSVPVESVHVFDGETGNALPTSVDDDLVRPTPDPTSADSPR